MDRAPAKRKFFGARRVVDEAKASVTKQDEQRAKRLLDTICDKNPNHPVTQMYKVEMAEWAKERAALEKRTDNIISLEKILMLMPNASP